MIGMQRDSSILFVSGVVGHWDHPGHGGWAVIDEPLKEPLGRLVG